MNSAGSARSAFASGPSSKTDGALDPDIQR